jgi:ABC-type multidrug transport system ATPase subunit
MIIAQNITKRYGKVLALNDVTFTIESGKSIALWGANGAGKTTVIRCLLGVHPFEGTLTVDDIDVQKYGKQARTLIGYVPQEMAFFDMSVWETLQFYARLKKIEASIIPSVLEMVKLVGQDKKSVSALSGGMKQRLALAIALLSDPKILLLDEPTASLDAHAQQDFIHMIQDLNASGKTVVFSSHRFEEVAALSDQVIWLEGGTLKALCTPNELAVELGLRQWLRVEVGLEHHEVAIRKLTNEGYHHVPNGKAIYVNVETHQKVDILRLFDQVQIPIVDFDVTDSYAVPQHGEVS